MRNHEVLGRKDRWCPNCEKVTSHDRNWGKKIDSCRVCFYPYPAYHQLALKTTTEEARNQYRELEERRRLPMPPDHATISALAAEEVTP